MRRQEKPVTLPLAVRRAAVRVVDDPAVRGDERRRISSPFSLEPVPRHLADNVASLLRPDLGATTVPGATGAVRASIVSLAAAAPT